MLLWPSIVWGPLVFHPLNCSAYKRVMKWSSAHSQRFTVFSDSNTSGSGSVCVALLSLPRWCGSHQALNAALLCDMQNMLWLLVSWIPWACNAYYKAVMSVVWLWVGWGNVWGQCWWMECIWQRETALAWHDHYVVVTKLPIWREGSSGRSIVSTTNA